MYELDLVLNNLQQLIWHKTKSNHLTMCKNRAQALLKMLSTKSVYESYIKYMKIIK